MDNIEFISFIEDRIFREMMLGSARNENILTGLRNIKSDFNYIASKDSKISTIDILKRLRDERVENAKIYKDNNRIDLWLQENTEANILNSYLPAEPSYNEIIEFLETLSIPKQKSSFKKFQNACNDHFGQKINSEIILEFIEKSN